MLRRNSCRSQNRPLSRSRSSASIVRNPVHELTSIEPYVAERDAYLAATLSYNRAQPPNNGGGKTSRLQRQQSVRFVGPNAQPQRRLATRASMALVGNINMPRRPAGSDSHHLSSPSFEPREDAASLSYARLRKSRSMYTPSIAKTPNYPMENSDYPDMFNGWLPTPRYSSLVRKENEPFRSSGGPTLRTPKSMGFLSSDCERSMSRDSISSGHETVQRTQNRLYEPSERSSRLQSRPSSFFQSSYRHAPNPTSFPKSLRGSSNNNTSVLSSEHVYGANFPPIIPSQPPGLRTKARKISKSLKSRLKGFFSRPKNRNDLADQTGEHPQDLESDDGSCYRAQTPAQLPQEASLYRVVSHMPSFHAVPPSQQPRSRQASLGTIEAEDNALDDDKSRVTSWTNSTADTIANRPRSANWSRQYPSDFQQGGTEAGFSSHNQPSMHHNNVSHAGPIVNSDRVYSALMKRLRGTNGDQNQLSGKGQGPRDSVETNSLRSTSTIRRQARQPTNEGSAHTIRHVQYEDDIFQDSTEGSTASHYSSESTKSVIRRHQSSDSLQNYGHETCPSPGYGQGSGLSPNRNDMKPLAAGESQKRTLSGRSSAFFASPTCHLFRTTSPYRRALQESMKAAQADDQLQTPNAKDLSSLSGISLPTRRPSTEDDSDDDVRVAVAYAESVYSNSSEDNAPHVYSTSSALRSTEDEPGHQVHGDATIFINTERRQLPPACHTRDSSSASSVEWKTWLSANVSKLETPPTTLKPDFPQEPSSAPQDFSHVREKAEIETGIESDADDYLQVTACAGLPPKQAPNKDYRGPSVLAAMAREQSFLANPWQPKSTTTNENSPPVSGARPKSLYCKDASPMAATDNLRTIPSVPNVNTCVANRDSLVIEPRTSSLNTCSRPFDPLLEEARGLKRRSRTRLRAYDGSAKSSPGFTSALERQFGVSRTGSPRVWKAEESSGELGSEADPGIDELGRRDFDAQAMGSRRMVDLFLSSRQQRVAGSQTRQSSDSLSAAFV
ncbi:hypothetical protein CI102_322 [Trichoderma harzianum]|uniref:Uncharacterized protein n=1 Tax=Trichoderma harzianum CBS 226.95 TaxID=983964 RepID=A0A2T4A4F9_TRIHA|nr:hypothetical protein M431DRAFT_122204 [Trichoderma harzianum CBS 226.95]PKK55004.1 hypothetical protein CI102_322 [Trichoderma harzianum]PTB51926.1 hypothetical protein M431DRAFT_122204 [Trichoderma harzianum CBS 226.95]